MGKKNKTSFERYEKMIRIPIVLGVILLIFSSFSMLSAESYYPPRISHIEGGISYESAGDVDWTKATVNLPLFRGDRLYAKPDSRAEVEFGYYSFLRMSENTDVVFNHISEKAVSINLALGSIIIRSGKSFHMDVQTRVGMVQLKNRGLYRIDTDESGITRIVVRKGRAEVIEGGEKLKIKEGQMSTIGGDPSLHQAAFSDYDDDFDMWSSRRDALYASSESIEYVGGHYPGAYTLDNYGYWRTYSGLGRVWVPRVGVGWTPYRSGLWLNFSVGWTWLSYEPWGWLPYHHGYWHYYEPYGHWCWSPGFYGGYTSFGAWSPHLVNFYYGGGYVGWAPRVWGHGHRPNTVINNNTIVINNNNNTVINNNRGMTVVKATDFSRKRVETTMVSNVSPSVRNSFKAGLPENISRATRTSAASARTKASSSSRATSSVLTRERPTQSRTTDYKSSRGSSGTVSGKAGTAVSSRSATTREVGNRDSSMSQGRVSTKPSSRENSSVSSGRVRSIPSGTSGSSTRVTRPSTGSSSSGSVKTTRPRTTTSPKRPSGGSSDLSDSSVKAIPSYGNSYSRSGSGYSASSSSLSGSRVTSENSRIKSLTGTDVRPRVTTDDYSSRTAAKTYTNRSSSPGFWGRLFGRSSSKSSSSSSGTYSRSRSGSSRSYGSYSRPSTSSSSKSRSYSRPSSSSRPSSVSRPSSSSRPSSRPSSSSRPRRPN